MDNISLWHNYSLESAPFEDRASKQFHCPLPQWQKAFHALHRLVVGGVCSPEHTSRLALIIGGFGTGKSVLLSQFLSQIESSVECCLIRGSPSIRLIDLSLALATRFKLDDTIDALRQADMEQQLKLLLAACTKRPQQNYLLVIDDAHRLPAEALTALLRLAELQSASQQHALSLVLTGDIKLKARLSGLNDIRQLWVCELLPLDKQNTKMYLDYRLKQAGWVGTSPFDDAAVTRIHRLSGGIPGRINRVAEQLLIQYLAEGNQGNAATIMDLPNTQNIQLASSLTQPYTLPPSSSKKLKTSSTDAYFNSLYLKACNGCQTIYQNVLKKQSVMLISISFLMLIAITFSSAKLFTDPTLLLLKSTLFNIDPITQLSSTQEDYRTSLLSLYPAYGVPATPSIVLAELPRLKHTLIKRTAQKSLPSPPSDTSASRLIHHDQQALRNQKQGYAVQLMAMPSPDRLIHFLKKAQLYSAYTLSAGQFLKPSPHIFQGMSQHRAFYGLIYGPFKTWMDAQAWVRKQPLMIRSLHPWIRSMNSVKDAVKHPTATTN